MTHHHPPLRTREIEAIYRRVERARARPVMWATRVDETIGAGIQRALGAGLVAVPVAVLLFVHGPNPGIALGAAMLTAMAMAAALVGWRQWLWHHRALPCPDGTLVVVVLGLGNDPRMMALAERWVEQGGIGVLTHAQAILLREALDDIERLRTWERQHRRAHETLVRHTPILDRIGRRAMAVALDRFLPGAAANQGKQRL